MTAHKHASMIKAKADNMELVVFVKNDEWDLTESCNDALMFFAGKDYFLCLPQHKNACFHLLNGGESEFRLIYSISEEWTKGTTVSWTDRHWCMSDDFESRIKPRKEKRWIAITIEDGEMLCRERTFHNRDEAVDFFGPVGFQYIEIGVDV